MSASLLLTQKWSSPMRMIPCLPRKSHNSLLASPFPSLTSDCSAIRKRNEVPFGIFVIPPPLPSHPSSIYLMGEKAWLGHHCPLGPGPSHMYTVVPIPQADYSEPSSAQERHLIHNKIWKLNYLLKSKIFNTFLQIYPRTKNNMTSSFRDTFETKV